jgi:hypothetical protein
MSSDATPPQGEGGGGEAVPFKMSFGGASIKGKGKALLTRPTTTPVVKPTSAFGASSNEAPTERHVDELIRGLDGNRIERYS